MYEKVAAKANELGQCRAEGGINWAWYYFPGRPAAEAFVKWLDENGIENRGVYEPRDPPRVGIDTDSFFGVRWR